MANTTVDAVVPEWERDISQVLLSHDQIRSRVAEMGHAISKDYEGHRPVVVGVLRGVIYFMADLLRALSIPADVDFIAISSYSAASRERGFVRFIKDLDIPIAGREVLFVEDIIDTGLTLGYLLRNLRARQPREIQVCVLFDKPAHRLIELPIKYRGFELPDRLVVGYGLDYRDKYRNLPFVGLLKPDAFRHAAG